MKNQTLPNQVFKAIGNEQLNSIHDRFYRNYIDALHDDYYSKSFLAKQQGQKSFSVSKKITDVKDAMRLSIYDDYPALGSVRLRHSSVAQPLVEADVNAFLPFDKNAIRLEQLWTFLLKLEDLVREENEQNSNYTPLIRFIVHSLQFNTTSDASTKVDPSDHQKFVYFLNDSRGQHFLTRFLETMPPSFLKRFFFTSFIVFKDVKIAANSQFAEEFLKRLITYLEKDKPKPKWLCAFIRQAVSTGFVHIAKDEFKSACFATLILTSRYTQKDMKDSDQMLLNTTMKNVADIITKDLGQAIRTQYDSYFMESIFANVLHLQPKSELSTLIQATSV